MDADPIRDAQTAAGCAIGEWCAVSLHGVRDVPACQPLPVLATRVCLLDGQVCHPLQAARANLPFGIGVIRLVEDGGLRSAFYSGLGRGDCVPEDLARSRGTPQETPKKKH
eukprot:2984155-Prymnesium_polylepis.1